MNVLITGGTGLIGQEISKQLLAKGHIVKWLSRHPKNNSLGIDEFKWDTEEKSIDLKAFKGVDTIINLAGAPINARWTHSYKREIISSRVNSIYLLTKIIKDHNFQVKTFISASAVGFYPHDYDKEHNEEHEAGLDFLSEVCKQWEEAVHQSHMSDMRTLICRIGIVLSNEGGALAEMVKPIKMGFGAPLGNGKQWMPWIHIKDIAGIFIFLAEQSKLEGIFNGVGPSNITNAALTKDIAQVMGKPQFLPGVPGGLLKLALGEMAKMTLVSNKVSNAKIVEAGYEYHFNDVESALKDLLR